MTYEELACASSAATRAVELLERGRIEEAKGDVKCVAEALSRETSKRFASLLKNGRKVLPA